VNEPSRYANRRFAQSLVVAALLALTMVVTAAPAQALVPATPDTSWGTNGTVWTVAHIGEVVYVGGRFTEVREKLPGTGGAVIPAKNLAAFDAVTGEPLDWTPRATGNSSYGEVYTIVPSADGSRLYVGGAFTSINGVSRKRIAALDPDTGQVLSDFVAGPDWKVRAILPGLDRIYIGGDFKSVAGVPRGHLAALSPLTGALDPIWKPYTRETYLDDGTKTEWAGRVTSLQFSGDGRIFVAGDFTAVNDIPRRSIAAVSAVDGSVDTTFKPYVEDSRTHGGQHIFDLTLGSGGLYAAMGGRRNYLAEYNPKTGSARKIFCDGDPQGVALAGDTLYVAGHFDLFAGVPHKRLAAVATSGFTTMHEWAPSTNSYYGVWGIDATADRLFIGGQFTWVSGQPRPYFAKFSTPDDMPPSPPTGLTATATSSSTVELSWTASEDSDVVEYEVVRDGQAIGSLSGTTFTDTTVVPETRYTYMVRARDASGNWSAASEPVEVTTPADTTPPPPESMIFGDGFESGSFANWDGVTSGLHVEQGDAYEGAYAARGTTNGGAAMAYRTFGAEYSDLYYRIRFKFDALDPNDKVVLGRIQRKSTPASLAIVYLKASGTIGYRSEVASVDRSSSVAPAVGVWHTLVLHVVVNGDQSRIEVAVDGDAVPNLNRTESLGTEGAYRAELGDKSSGTYDVVFDDVEVSSDPPPS
jgi:hypothetical protein